MATDRLITKYTCAHNGRAALVYFNAKSQQYRVQFYKDGLTQSVDDLITGYRPQATEEAERFVFRDVHA